LRCAELGYKTLVLSTDPAHSLADSLDVPLIHDPREVRTNFWAAELDALIELESNWGAVKKYITTVLQAQGLDGIQAEELAILPGMDEIFSLVRVKRHYDEADFDVLIIDSAPTGTALRLLSLPEVAGWYVRKFFRPMQGIAKTLTPIFSPMVKGITGIPLPNNEVMDAPFEFYEKIEALERVLTDNTLTTVRIVTNPEKMVIKESMRAHAYLSLYNVATDMVIANRVIPDHVEDPYFQQWKASQQIYRKEIQDSFSPLPIQEIPLYQDELVGFAALERLKVDLYGELDPSEVLYKEQTLKVIQEKGAYRLDLYLPGIPKSEVKLTKTGDELNIRIGNHRRNLVLPQSLAALQPSGAKMEDDYLQIRFSAS
jgi:arsenite/tail-anchored protein-transporting ATPase